MICGAMKVQTLIVLLVLKKKPSNLKGYSYDGR